MATGHVVRVALRAVLPAVLALILGPALLLLTLAAPAAQAAPEWAERETEYLRLRYLAADETEVAWYAGFVQDAYLYVSDVFGHAPRSGIVVTFYSDETAYTAANPLGGEEGVLAHATPSTREVGLALWRLRQQSEGLRRDAVRHELAHVVLGELSDQRLTIGFHEGLAQYVEQDGEQRAKLVQALRRGVEAGRLLDFADLNRQRPFLARAGVAYPQSYAVAYFLAERYGFGHLVRLVGFSREEQELDAAVRRAFDRSLAELEGEWRAWLPGYLAGGSNRNELDLWDMAEPRRLLAESKYAEAREGLERAERLFADLGRAEKLEQARAYLRQSSAGLEATDLGRRGTTALEGYDYDTAAELLGQAEALWTIVGDDSRRQQVGAGVEQARRGAEALNRLEGARAALEAWQISEASAAAYEAGLAFSELGDAGRVEQANAVLDEVRTLQTRAGLLAIGGGAIGLGGLVAAWQVGRRSRRADPAFHLPIRRPVTPFGAREHDWSL